MSEYKAVKGLGDTITCDECNDIAEDWFTGESRAICQDCYSQMPMSWSEVADLTHVTQVERFGWCSCEDLEPHEYPYEDCLKENM
jgi:RecJ-like exonuclease